MKRYIQSAAILALFLVAFSASSIAQGHLQDRVTVKIPFSFEIGQRTFTPGTYTVKCVSQTAGVYFIRNEATKEVRTISGTASVQAPSTITEPRLVFRSHDGQYFLKQVWTSGLTNGSELPKSRAEREIGKLSSVEESVTIAGL
jgi:hypothetical protein